MNEQQINQMVRSDLEAGRNRLAIVRRLRGEYGVVGLKEAVDRVKAVEIEIAAEVVQEAIGINLSQIKSVSGRFHSYSSPNSLYVVLIGGEKQTIGDKTAVEIIRQHIADLGLIDANPKNHESLWVLQPDKPKKLSDVQSTLLAAIVEKQWLAKIDETDLPSFNVDHYSRRYSKATVAKLAAYGYITKANNDGFYGRVVVTERAIEAYLKIKTFEQYSTEIAKIRYVSQVRADEKQVRLDKARTSINTVLLKAGMRKPEVTISLQLASYGSGLEILVYFDSESVLIDSPNNVRVNYNKRTRANGSIEDIGDAISALEVARVILGVWDEL